MRVTLGPTATTTPDPSAPSGTAAFSLPAGRAKLCSARARKVSHPPLIPAHTIRTSTCSFPHVTLYTAAVPPQGRDALAINLPATHLSWPWQLQRHFLKLCNLSEGCACPASQPSSVHAWQVLFRAAILIACGFCSRHSSCCNHSWIGGLQTAQLLVGP